MKLNLMVIQDKIREGRYEEAIKIVREAIKEELVCLIKKKNDDFVYTDIYNLIKCSEKYIDGEKKTVARCLYSPEYLLINDKDELIMLLENYKRLIDCKENS